MIWFLLTIKKRGKARWLSPEKEYRASDGSTTDGRRWRPNRFHAPKRRISVVHQLVIQLAGPRNWKRHDAHRRSFGNLTCLLGVSKNITKFLLDTPRHRIHRHDSFPPYFWPKSKNSSTEQPVKSSYLRLSPPKRSSISTGSSQQVKALPLLVERLL